MAWQTPKTDWVTNPKNPKPEDFNRIESNIEFLKNDIETKKGIIATAITDMNQAATASDTYLELADKIRSISNDATAAVGDVEKSKTFYAGGSKKTGTLELTGNAAVGDVLSGKTFYNTDLKTKRTGTMPNKGATNITISEFRTTIPAGYYNGSGKIVMPLVAGDEIALYRGGSFKVWYSTSGSNWTKVCELTMHAAGRVRISFDLRGALHEHGRYYVGPGYGRIYKNGSPAGIERVVYSDKTTRFTEDFNVQNDDKVQLYLRTTTENSYVRAGDLTVSIQIPFDKTSVVERTY